MTRQLPSQRTQHFNNSFYVSLGFDFGGSDFGGSSGSPHGGGGGYEGADFGGSSSPHGGGGGGFGGSPHGGGGGFGGSSSPHGGGGGGGGEYSSPGKFNFFKHSLHLMYIILTIFIKFTLLHLFRLC